ncbi:MAG: MASE4 domain-containing protein [Chloroflexi bacterium]|nr:MASE4 domain-containing protein [Chloroflexota bacterium]
MNLTSARPTSLHYRVATGLGVFLIGATVLILPIARQAGPHIQVFLAIYASLASAADLVTAYLLFGQFRTTRIPALAVLATTYLYSGMIMIPYVLTFPMVFSTGGLLDAGPQTAVWLWICWHAGFPAGILLYRLVDHHYRRTLTAAGARRLAVVAALLAPTLVALLTIGATVGHRYLPVMVKGGRFTALFSLASPLGVVLCGVALAACLVLWWGRQHAVAQLWLTVAALACVLDIAINLYVPGRYTVGWYTSRFNTLVSASVVLLALLYEVTQLYSRLSRSELRFRTLIDQAPIGACIVDEQGVLETVNDAYCAISGFARDEMVGRAADLFHPLLASPAPDEGEPTQVSQMARQKEYEVQTKDGQPLIVLSSSIRLSGVDDSPQRATFVVDITERARVARALEDARERALQAEHEKAIALEQGALELERSNAELQQFAYVASHDLQEPLRTISSYLTLLQRRYQGKLDEDADEFIAFAVDGAQRMHRLIKAVLDYSRVSTKSVPFHHCACTDVVDDAVASLHARIADAGAIVTRGDLPVVMGDPGQLNQLFQNLIGNALKFTRDQPPEVEINAEKRESTWVVSVQDNGIGIDPADAERIFAMFQRLHTRDEYDGTGIGLATCKRIVERHGGRIWVESRQGQGATFRFTLPADYETSEKGEAAA